MVAAPSHLIHRPAHMAQFGHLTTIIIIFSHEDVARTGE
jgi:hypothetical protein